MRVVVEQAVLVEVVIVKEVGLGVLLLVKAPECLSNLAKLGRRSHHHISLAILLHFLKRRDLLFALLDL